MRLAPVLLALLGLSACTASRPAAVPAPPGVRHENLNAVLWMQTAAEYRANSLSVYRGAQAALGPALADTAWSAEPAQTARGGFGALPPAVVLDADETVLDNSAYQARLVARDTVYDGRTWAAWVAEERAGAVPGALDYARDAARRGVRVVYLTNRRADEEASTARTLEALGFPVADGDALLTRGERPEWAASDKGPRRAFVAARYRVVQYVGDNLGDFVSGENATVEARAALAASYEEFWGTRWFMLANPTYGSWEGALTQGTATPEAARAAKVRALRQR